MHLRRLRGVSATGGDENVEGVCKARAVIHAKVRDNPGYVRVGFQVASPQNSGRLLAMVIGINSTKDAIYIAETIGSGVAFEVEKITRLQFELSGSSDLADLLKNLKTVLAALHDQECDTVAILCCSSGQFGSSLEAVKAEAVVQLAAHDCGFTVIGIKPQSLRSALGCAKGEQWQAKSKELFNGDGSHKYWTQGANGAAAAAYKATNK